MTTLLKLYNSLFILLLLRVGCQEKTSEIHSHSGCLFFAELSHLRFHDAINTLAEIQDTWAVCRNNDGAIGLPLYNVAQDLPLGRHIEGAGSLVKKQYGSPCKYGTRNRQSLRLTGRETVAALADIRFKTAWFG